MRKARKTKHLDLVNASFEREIALINRNTDLLAFLEERSNTSKTLTLDQVRETLGLNELRRNP
jgi:hypothetical protein